MAWLEAIMAAAGGGASNVVNGEFDIPDNTITYTIEDVPADAKIVFAWHDGDSYIVSTRYMYVYRKYNDRAVNSILTSDGAYGMKYSDSDSRTTNPQFIRNENVYLASGHWKFIAYIDIE